MKTKKIIQVGQRILLLTLFTETLSGQVYQESMKYGQFLHFLDKYYVDSINTGKLVEDAIIYQLKQLDPHSTYISADDVQKMNEPLQGNFEGIGVSFNILNDTLFVINPTPNGPSEKVGIIAGDRIVRVDGKNIAGIGLTNDDVFALLRGPKGTKVDVTVKRRAIDQLLEFEIIRDKIPITSIDAAYIITEGVGYIKLNRFSLTTMDEFFAAGIELKKHGGNDLILDLTGNTGGYLDMAVALADQFLDDEKLIVYTEGVHSERRDYLASAEGLFEEGRVIILIDEESASASEIVAGAIQDWDRGIIIGRRSFGKGLVQRQLELPDGSMIRLTTAKYYTPTGRLIQKPYNNGLEDYQNEIYKRFQHGEFINSDSIFFPDSLRYETLLNKRIVFGGGGIMPDIFIPLDTSLYSNYEREIIRQGILNRFILQYVDRNRKKLSTSFKNVDQLNDDFLVTSDLILELENYATEIGLKSIPDKIDNSDKKFNLLIKAYIARDLFSNSEFYEIINQSDTNVQKAVEVFNNWEQYSEKVLF
jgi:carboxyl-terminal processing protease